MCEHHHEYTDDFHLRTRVAKPTEFCPVFIQGMADRMATSFHKYGPLVEAPRGLKAIRQPDNIRRRLALYEETGNTEWLMDIANFAMIEFMMPAHPDAHYRPTDSDESPGLTTASGVQTQKSHRERALDQVSGSLRQKREGD